MLLLLLSAVISTDRIRTVMFFMCYLHGCEYEGLGFRYELLFVFYLPRIP